MQEQKEETKTYECGLRINSYPIIQQVEESLIADDLKRYYSKVNILPETTKTPLGDFLSGNKKPAPYKLTEEEEAKFNAIEGCTPEEITIAKEIFSKTLEGTQEDPLVRWKIYGGGGFGSGGHKKGGSGSGYSPGKWSPFGASRMNQPLLPNEMLNERIDELEAEKFRIACELSMKESRTLSDLL